MTTLTILSIERLKRYENLVPKSHQLPYRAKYALSKVQINKIHLRIIICRVQTSRLNYHNYIYSCNVKQFCVSV